MSEQSAAMHQNASERKEGFDWQLLRRIDAGDPEYAIDQLTRRGMEALNLLASAGYVEIDGQTVTVTMYGLAALIPNYPLGYAQDIILFREQVAELTARLNAMEAGR